MKNEDEEADMKDQLSSLLEDEGNASHDNMTSSIVGTYYIHHLRV